MSTYVKVYFADTKEGYWTADDEVSLQGDFTNPVLFVLRADLEETDEARLYAKAEIGYEIQETEISLAGTSAAKWQLSLDDPTGGADSTPAPAGYEAAGDPVAIGLIEDDVNSYFWVKASVTDDELPTNDVSVTLELEGIVLSTA